MDGWEKRRGQNLSLTPYFCSLSRKIDLKKFFSKAKSVKVCFLKKLRCCLFAANYICKWFPCVTVTHMYVSLSWFTHEVWKNDVNLSPKLSQLTVTWLVNSDSRWVNSKNRMINTQVYFFTFSHFCAPQNDKLNHPSSSEGWLQLWDKFSAIDSWQILRYLQNKKA